VIGERFYRAFLAADVAALAEVVAPNAVLVVPLQTALSGSHRGPEGIAALRERIADLTDGTWRPLRDESFDVALSQWHAVVMDRFLAERDGRQLDSHEAFVLAVEDDRIVRLFHYLHDPDGFAAFWSVR
jgi:ketosteroid isomerase-like protein